MKSFAGASTAGAPGEGPAATAAFKAGRYFKYRSRLGVARLLFGLGAKLAPRSARIDREVRKIKPKEPGALGHVRFVALGTTGQCNASCIHCPTGKPETALSPRTPMPMPIFRKIIDGIADGGLAVTDQLVFGLFGDALVDPMVVERARYASERLPDIRLGIVTNDAAFNVGRHGLLKDYVSVVALHCDSLIPECFE